MIEASDFARTLNASAICCSCGLCCDGSLNFFADLGPDEVAAARACGLDVRETPTITGFRLPCPQLKDQQCAVYYDARRPRNCRGYTCWVMERYLLGRLSARNAQRTIRVAITLRAAVAGHIGDAKATGIIRLAKAVVKRHAGRNADETGDDWKTFEGLLTKCPGSHDQSGRVNAELIRDVLRAGTFLRRHFVWPASARKRPALRELAAAKQLFTPTDRNKPS